MGVVPGSNGAGRAVPDVGLDADPTTGMLIGETQTFPDGVYYDEYRIGGTSLASPLFAGMTALLLQHAGGAMGLLNPTIYAQAGSSSFKDVHGTPQDAGNIRVDYANGVDPIGRPRLLRAHVQPGLVPQARQGLGRRHRCRFADSGLGDQRRLILL